MSKTLKSNWSMVAAAAHAKRSKKSGAFRSKLQADNRSAARLESVRGKIAGDVSKRMAERAAVGKIPFDHCGWGYSQDGTGVWYKTAAGNINSIPF